jgi:hypothetical protein
MHVVSALVIKLLQRINFGICRLLDGYFTLVLDVGLIDQPQLLCGDQYRNILVLRICDVSN